MEILEKDERHLIADQKVWRAFWLRAITGREAVRRFDELESVYRLRYWWWCRTRKVIDV